ncbi:MAG: 1-acyl-sn-glycerol-3-phosphate acyltransferase [Myxococcaceae bacterium]|nr:1-acyl-sn-glycerol-3-phosphate acyltransferase [Myxococcaceae bacterium]
MTAEHESPSAAGPASLRAWLTSSLFWSYLAGSSPLLWSGAVLLRGVTAPFDRKRKLLHLYTSAWAYHYVKLFPLWKTHFEGIEQIRGDRTYVLVANHQSLGDILVLFGLFKHFKWVSKREIFKVPFIGWNMLMNDYVGLKRGDASSVSRMLAECRTHLKHGSSVMLFPEGTRSHDGELKSFKHGAFTLARELGLEVVPIVIDGTRDALPKRGLLLRQSKPLQIRVHVLAPVAPDAAESVQALSELVRDRMVSELAHMRGKPATPASATIAAPSSKS